MRISIKHKIKAHLAACALAGMAFSGSALSAIVYSGPVSISMFTAKENSPTAA